jgi:hypothetical protein
LPGHTNLSDPQRSRQLARRARSRSQRWPDRLRGSNVRGHGIRQGPWPPGLQHRTLAGQIDCNDKQPTGGSGMSTAATLRALPQQRAAIQSTVLYRAQLEREPDQHSHAGKMKQHHRGQMQRSRPQH